MSGVTRGDNATGKLTHAAAVNPSRATRAQMRKNAGDVATALAAHYANSAPQTTGGGLPRAFAPTTDPIATLPVKGGLAHSDTVTPSRRAPRTSYPATSGMGALALAEGQPSMDNPATYVTPQDQQQLHESVGRIAHNFASKEGNLRTMALVSSLLEQGKLNMGAANRIHVGPDGSVHFSGTPAQQREAASLLAMHGGLLGSAQELLGTGPGLALMGIGFAHHPLGEAKSVAKGIGSSMAGTFTLGHYGSKSNTPLDNIMNLWVAGSLLHGAGTRAARAAASGSLKDLAVRPYQEPRVLRVGDPGFEQTIVKPTSRNSLAAAIQRGFLDRTLHHGVQTGNPDLGGMLLRRLGSAPTRLGRAARAHLARENDRAMAPVHELNRYGETVTKRLAAKMGREPKGLSPAQQHAISMYSTGLHPERLARAFENGMTHAEEIAAREGVPADFVRQNHENLYNLTKISGRYFDEHGQLADETVQKAADAVARAMNAREGMRGMSEEDIAHALGSRAHAFEHLADNPTGESLHQELERLAKVTKGVSREDLPDQITKTQQQLHEVESEIKKLPPATERPSVNAVDHPAGSAAGHRGLLREQSDLRTRLEQLHEQADAFTRQDEIHHEFTQTGQRLKGFYLPTMSEDKPLSSKVMSTITRSESRYGFGPPKGETTHAQMGHLVNRGDFRTQAIPLAQHAFSRAQRIQAAQRLHEMLLALSKETPEQVGHHAPVLVREGNLTEEIKRLVNELHPGSPHEAEGEEAARLHELMLPQNAENVPVRYLHPDIASLFGPPRQAGPLLRNVNRFNQLVRAQRFLNPKYFLWNPQNAALAVPQQGLFAGANLARYLRVVRHLPAEDLSQIEAAVGSHGMSHGITVPGDTALVQHLANFWHHMNDHVYRMMSFVHEARRAGYHTAEDYHRLLNDPAESARLHQIQQDANDKSINYNSMSPNERESLHRALAYYPWIRGSAVWTAQMLRDHPLFAALEMEAGRRGEKYVRDFFARHGGIVPPALESQYPAKGGPVDLAFLTPQETPAQIAEAVSGITNIHGEKYLDGSFLGMAAPALKLLADITLGRDRYGNQPKSGTVLGMAAHDLGSSIEPLQLIKQFVGKGRAATPNSPSGTMHEVERWAGWPQQTGVNYNQLAQEGASIERSSLRGVAQAALDTKQQEHQVSELVSKAHLPPQAVSILNQFWQREGARNAQLTQAAWKSGDRSDDYRKAIKALGYNHPDLYFMATARTVAALIRKPGIVPIAQRAVNEIMKNPNLTPDQRATVLRQHADDWWGRFNPKTVKSAYYKLLDKYNLNS